jgi:hypothetical protein
MCRFQSDDDDDVDVLGLPMSLHGTKTQNIIITDICICFFLMRPCGWPLWSRIFQSIVD